MVCERELQAVRLKMTNGQRHRRVERAWKAVGKMSTRLQFTWSRSIITTGFYQPIRTCFVLQSQQATMLVARVQQTPTDSSLCLLIRFLRSDGTYQMPCLVDWMTVIFLPSSISITHTHSPSAIPAGPSHLAPYS